jgi:hypothetical protein
MNIPASTPRVATKASALPGPGASTSRSGSFAKPLTDTISAHPYRAITDVLSLSIGIANFIGSTHAPTRDFLELGAIVAAAGHGMSAFTSGYLSLEGGGGSGVSALGEALCAVGHAAVVSGVGPLGLGLFAFGKSINSIAEYRR